MKQLFLLMSFMFCCLLLSAQVNDGEYSKQANDFLEWRFKLVRQPLVFAECLDTSTFNYLKQFLTKDSFYRRITYDGEKTIVIDTLCFNKTERRFIDSLFSDRKNFEWINSPVINSAIISSKTVDSLYKKPSHVSEYLNQYYHANRFLYTSKPIFLKNYTLCILYDASAAGRPFGDGSTLIVFKKINNTWKVFWVLEESVS
jgi:hypothetical protein